MKIKELAKRILTEREERRYEALLRSRKGSYGAWLAAGGAWMEAPAEMTEGPGNETAFVITCMDRGTLAPGAEGRIRRYFREHPEVLLLYGDEDIKGQAEGGDVGEAFPWLKPDWSPDLLDSFCYFGGMAALREELFRRASAWMPSFTEDTGSTSVRYRTEDMAAWEKWLHICAELAGGYQKGSRSIGHIPEILFHQESREAQRRFLQFTDFLRQSEERLRQDFRDGWIVSGNQPGSKPVISVVIPSKDHPEVLEKCLRGCLSGREGVPVLEGRKQEEPALEIIVVDNGSSDENKRLVEGMIRQLAEPEKGRNIRYFYVPMEFHFSKMCNLGAAVSEGNFLLFLNDDVELGGANILTEMAALADRAYTGAVGLKLYYPDSHRIQHAGITNLPMGPVHKLQFMEDHGEYYYGANRGNHNVLAVTAACLMVEKEKYLEAGGFSEELPVAFNDVDFCFCLYELGYRNVCMNSRYAWHHESLSRGDDEAPEKVERLLRERDKLYERHPGLAGADPYYSVHLNRKGLDTGIRPAYLTAGNETQQSGGRTFRFDMKGYRSDTCLMARVEDCRGRSVVGYSVVLGDNNACWEKLLLLGKMPGTETLQGRESRKNDMKMTEVSKMEMIYALRIKAQYRPDLEENMPDQVNVALCGFDIEIEAGEIPAGKYRLGIAARNRAGGLKLMNWSGRFLQLEG